MNKDTLGAMVMAGMLLLMGAVALFFEVGTDAIPEQAVEASMGLRMMPQVSQDRSAQISNEECFPTDAKQPFKFKACYVPKRTYAETSIDVVFFPETPALNRLEFSDLTRKVGKIIRVSSSTGESGKNLITSKTESSTMTFRLPDLFSGTKPDPPSRELKMTITLQSDAGNRAIVEGTLEFGK